MMFKNSVKLLYANFHIVWKLLLYYIIVAAVTVGLIAPFFPLIFDSFGAAFSNFEPGLSTVFTNWASSFGLMFDIMAKIILGIQTMFAVNAFAVIYLFVVIFLLFPFLLNLAKLAVSEVLYGYMSSLSKYSFTLALVKNLGKGASFAILRTLFAIPFTAVIMLSTYGIFSLATNSILVYFIPVLMLIVLSVVLGLKETLVCGWAPSMVVFGSKVFIGYNKGIRAVNRRFLKVLSTSIMIMFIISLLNITFGLYAFIITIPVGLSLIMMFEMAMFFASQGMRFYVDMDTILTPKRLEESDNIIKAKYII